MQCGKAAKMIFPRLTILPSEAGTILYVMGIIMGLIIWAMAIPWMCFAVGSVLRLKMRFPFNIGWWAFLYPVGMLNKPLIRLATRLLTWISQGGVASATITLGAELESAFFRVIAEVLTAIIVLVWVICFARTVRGAFSGELFPKPGVCELRPDSGAKVRLPTVPILLDKENDILMIATHRPLETCWTAPNEGNNSRLRAHLAPANSSSHVFMRHFDPCGSVGCHVQNAESSRDNRRTQLKKILPLPRVFHRFEQPLELTTHRFIPGSPSATRKLRCIVDATL